LGVGEDALIFDRRTLALPERTPELTETFEAYAAAMIRHMTPQATFEDQVRVALVKSLLGGGGQEDEIAGKLGLSKRTMRRRLAETEPPFRGSRHTLLRERAEALLRDEKLPIAEVSYLLGCSQTSTVHPAFRRCTGFSPGEWRRRQPWAADRAP